MKFRKLKMVFVVLVFLCSKGYSQVPMLVEDVMSLAAVIENGFQMFRQLQQAIETYKQIQMQVEQLRKQAQNLDLTKYDWTKIDGILTLADDYLTYYDQLDSLMNSKSMKVGNVSFSINDVYSTNLYESLLDEAERNLLPWNMTEEDQARFASRHGMTAAHYYTTLNIEHEIAREATELKAVLGEQKKKMKTAMEGSAEVIKQSADPVENDLQAEQISNQLQANMLNVMLFTSDAFQRSAELSMDFQKMQMQTMLMDQENVEKASNYLYSAVPLKVELDFCGKKNDYIDFNAKPSFGR